MVDQRPKYETAGVDTRMLDGDVLSTVIVPPSYPRISNREDLAEALHAPSLDS